MVLARGKADQRWRGPTELHRRTGDFAFFPARLQWATKATDQKLLCFLMVKANCWLRGVPAADRSVLDAQFAANYAI